MARPLFLRSPRLGVLNLVGERAGAAVAEDLKSFGSLFGKPVAAPPGGVPACDVLLLYCEMERNGTLKETGATLASFVETSKAKVLVAAWNNPTDSYYAATKGSAFPTCSVIATVDRRGPSLSALLRRLFMDMFVGNPIAAAWVKLAPEAHDDQANVVFTPAPEGVAFSM